ncbi:hypothetical protein FRB96_000671 [Tulasnella sp. 330]|nr:hypothetical protein FRB96_000671 [Tulasnella sp. 330]
MSDLVEVTCGQLPPTFLPTTHLALMVPEIILEYLVYLFDERNYRNIRDIDTMALHFITPPDPNDWNRFYKYASLVSTLYFNDTYLLHGFMNLKKVGPRSEDDLMLPNLQALELLPTTPVALGRTLNFVPSTLTTFTAKCHTILSQYQSQIFDTIADRLSMLYELSLLGVETTIKVDQAIAGLLKALSNLRIFTIEYGEVEERHSEWILESTARAMESSSLEYLDVRREKPTWPASPLRWNNRQGGFRDLIELQIRCDMHEGTLSLLSNIGTHGHSLRRLTLIQEAVYGPSDEVSLLPLIITVRKHEELDQFRIEAHRTSSLTAATLEPLGLCVRLKSLEMNITDHGDGDWGAVKASAVSEEI